MRPRSCAYRIKNAVPDTFLSSLVFACLTGCLQTSLGETGVSGTHDSGHDDGNTLDEQGTVEGEGSNDDASGEGGTGKTSEDEGTDSGTDSGDSGESSDDTSTSGETGTADDAGGGDESGTGDYTGSDSNTDDGDGEPPDCSVGSVVPQLPKSIVAYYTAWSIYARGYEVADIPAEKITHLNYAFANLSTTGECILGDPWADVDRVTGDLGESDFQGNFGGLVRLREEHPHLETLISVGGWTWSDHFSSAAATAASRAAMASSCIAFMRRYRFNGIDLDWEYPVSGGEPGNTTSPADKHNYTLLLQEFRQQLDQAEDEDQTEYRLTIAAPAGPDIIQNYELEVIHESLDWINIMAYDFHGSWSPTTNFNAPLFSSAADPNDGAKHLSVDSAVKAYLGRGVPPEKIVVGVPFYGRGWQGVSGGQSGLYASFTGIPMGTWEAGVFDYHDIVANYLPTLARFFSDDSLVPWLYDPTSGIMISYDDTESMACKANYISSRELAGAMFWELSGDLRAGPGLLDVLNDVLR